MSGISLAHLTVLDAPPPELVRIAGSCGYDFVGLRLLEVVGGDSWPLASDPQLMRETRQAMADHGVGVLDVELARLQPQTDVAGFAAFLETAAEIGARHVLTQAHDPEWARLVENFAGLCALAGSFGLTVDVEFLTWTEMRDLAAVRKLIDAAAAPNAGVMIDTLHFYRSGCDPAEIEQLDPGLLHFIQIADAPAAPPETTEGLIYAAREDRLDPGTGELDLIAIIERLPPETSIAVEIPNSRLAARLTGEERACRALEATRQLLARARRPRAGC